MNKFITYFSLNKRGLISVVVFIIVWKLFASFGIIDELFISSPEKVLASGIELIASGVIWKHLWISVLALGGGMAFSIIFGVFFGVLLGFYENLYQYAKPFIFTLNALPKIAIFPLIIIWFGIGLESKIAIIFLMSVSSILINTIDGVKNVDKNLVLMANSFGASKMHIIKTICFFNALPSIFTGISLAIGKAVTGVVIAEVFGYGLGLGHLVSRYGSNYQTGRLMFVIIILLLLSLLLVWLNESIRKVVIYWEKN